jgi:hypothetical protein
MAQNDDGRMARPADGAPARSARMNGDAPPPDAARNRWARPWLLVAIGVILAALGLLASLHGLNLVVGQEEMSGRLLWVVAGWIATGAGLILAATGVWRGLER